MQSVRTQLSRGFTLIEVLVSLSIFTIVVTICVSTLYTLIEANSRARNSQSIATNLSFTLDSMTREIRTGADYFCTDTLNDLPFNKDDVDTRDCPLGASMLSFNEGGQSLTYASKPQGSRRIAYRLSDGKLQRRIGGGDGLRGENEEVDWLSLTSDDIVIERLRFYVEGSERGNEEAPVVTVELSGIVGDDATTESEFSIQTTIAQRLLDI